MAPTPPWRAVLVELVRPRLSADVDVIRGLTAASVGINGRLVVDEMLDEFCRHALRLTAARLAIATVVPAGDWSVSRTRWRCLDEDIADAGDAVVIDGTGIEAEVCATGRTVRRSSVELAAATAASGGRNRPALRGWLAAPLVSSHGHSMGLVQVSRREEGEFSTEDEAVLEALAQMVATAVEKVHIYELAAQQQLARFREEILAGISHDMQTPLAAIGGIVEMLADDPLDVEDRVQLQRALERQNRNLRTLVQQFLDFSRLETARELLVRPQPTDVVAVMEQAAELFEHQRAIILGAETGMPLAMADSERLRQVLVNLISNAVKYSEEPVRVVARTDGATIVVDVVDQGGGIDDDDLRGLFRKFHRGANAVGTEGTGLGLYVSRALVNAQGGALTVETTFGWGSRFRVSLPAATSHERSRA
jgi:K+-sensing histidine kinase KdpD